jgi:transcription elongation factor Elf1
MPLTGPIPKGRSFFCPRCGALYVVTYSRQWKSVDIGDDDNGSECVVCGKTMAAWSSTDVPTFKLIQRPEDAA